MSSHLDLISSQTNVAIDEDDSIPRDELRLVEDSNTEEAIKKAAASNKNIGKIIYMGITFLLLFIAISAQNLVSEVYEQHGFHSLGTFTLLFQAAAFGLGVLVVPKILKNWEYKTGIIVGAIGYIFVLVAGAMTTACGDDDSYIWCKEGLYVYGSNIIFALLHGFTAPMLWMSVNRYNAGLANPHNKGRFMGLFSSLFAASGIFGNLLSAICIKKFGQFAYYFGSSVFGCFTIILFTFAPHVSKYLYEDPNERILEQSSKIAKLAFSRGVRNLLPQMLSVGLMGAANGAFQYKVVLHTVPTMSKEDQNALQATMFFFQGIVQTFSAYISGKLADVVGSKAAMSIFNIFQGLAIAFALMSYNEQSLKLAYVMVGVWGFGGSGAGTLVNIIMAKDFEGSIEAYAVPQLMAVVASMTGYGLCIALADYVNSFFIILGGFLFLSQIVLWMYTPLASKGHQKKSEC